MISQSFKRIATDVPGCLREFQRKTSDFFDRICENLLNQLRESSQEEGRSKRSSLEIFVKLLFQVDCRCRVQCLPFHPLTKEFGMTIAESSKTVYGPVRSWRAGVSLGVDLLSINSICSFRCLYCQLGKINLHTSARKVYVPTERVMTDLIRSSWHVADIVTLSGSGEPTLAANLGEVIGQIKALTGKPVLVLTNGTTLNDPLVRLELCEADKIYCKLDASCEETFKRINRPVKGITLQSVITGLKALRKEFTGELAIQLMLTPLNVKQTEQFARILNEIKPDEVQLNLPLRPIPRKWLIDARGNNNILSVPSAHMKTITQEKAAQFEATLKYLTGLRVSSVPRIHSS